jgi:hypothetical protein
MATWIDGIIVSLLAIGATVLVGVVGYLIEKNDESAERNAPGDQRRAVAERKAPAERRG